MKIQRKNELTPEEFVAWAIAERKKRAKSGKARIDTKVAALHRQKRISDKLYGEYVAATNAAP